MFDFEIMVEPFPNFPLKKVTIRGKKLSNQNQKKVVEIMD